MTRRKTPGLDNPDPVKYLVRSLFPHVEPFQRQDRSSYVVQREELFTLEELKGAGGRLKANTEPGIDGVSSEILKEVIGIDQYVFCIQWEASGGVDSTTTSDSLGRGERSLGKPVRIQERQVHCGRNPSCS